MPKPKKGTRLGGSASHQRKILANLAAALIEHQAIRTTDAKARLLRPFVEKLITRARYGTLADRRLVLKRLPNKAVVNYLFDQLAEQFKDRNGGYTRIIKLDNRKGDNAPMSQISLVLDPVDERGDNRANRVAASQQDANEAPEVEADPATDVQAKAEAQAEEKADEVADNAAEEATTEADENAAEKPAQD